MSGALLPCPNEIVLKVSSTFNNNNNKNNNNGDGGDYRL
jgi:hypothetical protein